MIKELKVGELYWYSTQGGQFQFKLLQEPFFYNDQYVLIIERMPEAYSYVLDVIVGPDVYGRDFIYSDYAYMGVPTYNYLHRTEE